MPNTNRTPAWIENLVYFATLGAIHDHTPFIMLRVVKGRLHEGKHYHC